MIYIQWRPVPQEIGLSDPAGQVPNAIMNRNHPFQLDASSRTGFEQPSGSSFAASPPGSDAYCSSEPEDNSEDDDDDMDILLKAEDDEDALLMGINESNTSESPQDEAKGNILTLSETKKKRGRPRKSPSSPFKSQTKVAKGRTKTGCITCRRRKKKCDEAKPSCKPLSQSQAAVVASEKGCRFELPEECCDL